jgi:NAD(P)-dependent dehydrogenase (short-subunit alcohol dehydrogenase family)
MRFKEKVVFITGGTKGLGKAVAKAFLEEGAYVGVNGRNKEAVLHFEEEFKGKTILAFNTDITNYEEMENTARKVIETWGKVDILINIKGTFCATQVFGKTMIEQKSGRIISVASQVALFGEKGFLPYAIGKSALIVMTRELAYEWSKFGVTLCAIAPGFIKGGMNEGLIRKEIFVDYLSKRTPVNRMGNVEEFVSCILFLASTEAQYINGETIIMDGGMTGYTQEPLLDFISKGR